METKVQKKSSFLKKVLKRFLQLFIRIDTIPFSKNGRLSEYSTMYVFGLSICSNIYPAKREQNDC